jgi:hypothetical protein
MSRFHIFIRHPPRNNFIFLYQLYKIVSHSILYQLFFILRQQFVTKIKHIIDIYIYIYIYMKRKRRGKRMNIYIYIYIYEEKKKREKKEYIYIYIAS